MRVNVIGLLNQASDCIENRAPDTGAYGYMLSELAGHLAAVRDGSATWDEFAELYCLTERDRPKERLSP